MTFNEDIHRALSRSAVVGGAFQLVRRPAAERFTASTAADLLLWNPSRTVADRMIPCQDVDTKNVLLKIVCRMANARSRRLNLPYGDQVSPPRRCARPLAYT